MELSDPQYVAVNALVSGATYVEAADAAGVSRQTVSVWRNQHPAFRSELARRRRELADEVSDLVRTMDGLALRAVLAELEAGGIDAAARWLKLRRFEPTTLSAEPASARDELDAMAESHLQREAKLSDYGGGFLESIISGMSRTEAEEQIVGQVAESLAQAANSKHRGP